jgi:hypothetical protein
MDRRLFLTGLLGVAGTAAVASVFPRQADALPALQSGDFNPPSDVLPELDEPETEADAVVEPVYHGGYRHRRRRRRRVRRWRRRCRRYWHHGYWRRRCRRVPFWGWIWISI